MPTVPYRMGKNAAGRNDPQTPFPYSQLHGFSGIVPVKSWMARNHEAGGFVNSAVSLVNLFLVDYLFQVGP